MKIGDLVNTKTGITGPASAGIGDRFLADTDQQQGICYSAYHGNGQRVINVPILDDFGAGASTPSRVTGFATFFLRDIPDKKNEVVNAEYIYTTTVGSGGGGNANGAVSYVLRLVR
jgi:hypothetical protein